MLDIRDKIIDSARSFLGTPYNHQGRLKGIGIDCVGLVVKVAEEIGITGIQDRTDYSSRPSGILPIEMKQAGFVEIPVEERMPGDIGIFWFRAPHLPQHAAIFTEKGVVHTFNGSDTVIEQRLPQKWLDRLVHVFRFPGVL